MKRTIVMAMLVAAPLAAIAQQQPAAPVLPAPPAASSQDRIVAVINGETITQSKLDMLYTRMAPQLRTQYNQNGGKAAFLENYLRKRMLVQEALKAGFDKRPEVQPDLENARESALFDRYIRDVVAPTVITEAAVHKFYDDNPGNFMVDDQLKVRHIIIMGDGVGPKPKSKQQAIDTITRISAELREQNTFPAGTDPASIARITMARFAEAARKYSEDGSASQGGDLGWVGKGTLDPTFEAEAFSLQPGVISPVVESRFGFHLIFVEDKKPAGKQSYDEVKAEIRDYLTSQQMSDVMNAVTRLTNELKTHSKVAIYPENIR
jgi:peptidyl-prolyl cis-trans isomerase C